MLVGAGCAFVINKRVIEDHFSLLNDEQMSNKVGVEHQPDMSEIPSSSSECFCCVWEVICCC